MLSRFSLLLLFALTACRPDTTPERPNILFIFADDQRADGIHAWGNDIIQTPALDRLAGSGYSFRNVHVMGSIHGAVCQPSRAMLMSGRSLYHVYAQLDTVTTFPQQLRENGYVTFGTGKWHQSQASFAKSFGIGRNIMFGGMSSHDAVPIRQMRDDGTFTDVDSLAWSTDLYADAAIDFLDSWVASDTSAPFLAYVAFQTPHDPRDPKAEYKAMYNGADIPLPPNFLPVHPFHNGWMTGRDEQLAEWPRPEAHIKDQIAEYYGLITQMDAHIGDILDRLDELGLSDNTIVVYAADNGLALGSHGLLGKQNQYEHSIRSPLIIVGPGLPRSERCDALVTLQDLFPTLCELTGAAVPVTVTGRSLKPLLLHQTDRIHEFVAGMFTDTQRMICDGRWKYICYPKAGREQLFDLVDDPHEMKDLSFSALHKSRRAALQARLLQWCREQGDPDL